MKSAAKTRRPSRKEGRTLSPPASAAPAPRRGAIVIRGARTHNLRNISLELPRRSLVVVTGVSGSGKSSLAFNTLYAEGQRRFVESLSAYARQFLERMDKPDVDFIEGISPAIAIEQKTAARNPRSTVGTTTEVYDYLRLLFARIGKTFCAKCGGEVRRDSVRTVLGRLAAEGDELKLFVLFPLREAGPLKREIEKLRKLGFFRLVRNGEVIDLNERKLPAGAKRGELRVLVDRLIYRKGSENTRIADSIETAFTAGDGTAVVALLDGAGGDAGPRELRFSQQFACANCGIRYEEPDPRLFSFNNPFGACPRCQGFGRSVGIDMDLVVPYRGKSLRDGAIAPWTTPKWHNELRDLLRIAPSAGVRVDVPFRDLTPAELDVVMNGRGDFRGINGFFRDVEKKTYKIYYRILLSRYRGYTTCEACGGARLRPEALCVRIAGRTIADAVAMTIGRAEAFVRTLELSAFDLEVGRRILEELRRRLAYLVDVGIGYLTLDRLSNTLSGGETQRINLATALGSSLVGSLYVLDEPSVGLHPRDNERLIAILRALRDVGNTVVVVEHDAAMIRAADVVVDLGPRAGEHGGEIVAIGSVAEVAANRASLTGQYLAGTKSIPVPRKRRRGAGKAIAVRGAAGHNLKGIDVRIPLGCLAAVTGVSGSGKSTLVHNIVYAGLKKLKGEYAGGEIGEYAAIEGAEHIDDVELVDQTPIGRTPRSNPVTYSKTFDLIREVFASTQAAKIHGFTAGTFSFNIPGGRCETCEGSGIQTVEMQFLADLELTCEVCRGKRFRKEVLEIEYRGKTIDDVLGMTVTEAIEFFRGHASGRRVAERLGVLADVGLGYIRLGQSATTLSGGEAQRMKLASHLAAREGGRRLLFIFDEPTTGLHFDDIAVLLKAFDALIAAGNSVLVIEHNVDVIKCADWIIDLGPEAGDDGGRVVAAGTPEEIASAEGSYTGKFLKELLGDRP